ncbi:MAG: RNA polymerase sigma factor [Flavobacteriales bacterium]|jgi:RNA polymerase sigma factor (sigma-70 family)
MWSFFLYMNDVTLIPHLFRTEFRKIVSVLSRSFGLENIELAEDITSETFLLAAETWGKKGIPENPTAWLYFVAKNKTKDYLKRNKLFNEKVKHHFLNEKTSNENLEFDITSASIKDSELRMIFAICHPTIPVDSQIGLALRILFGFGIEEIADSFLTNKETINKRLHRAKEKLREENIQLELPNQNEISDRLSSVYAILYLVFNQGYFSSSQNSVLRKDLCFQALQLAYLLTESEVTNTNQLDALIALMCFHASRFEARIQNNEIILLEDQDTTLWNKELIKTGEIYLNKSATGDKLSKYHLEAAIAYWHTQSITNEDKWSKILFYYNLLLQIEYSPIAALNRTFALYKNNGPEKAIHEALKLNLTNNVQYHLLLGMLYTEVNYDKAISHLQLAEELTKSSHEKNLVQYRLAELLKKK